MRDTTDLWFMAYLVSKGHEIIKFEMLNDRKLKCYFNLDQVLWDKMRLEFFNSPEFKFKMYIEKVKELTR